MGVIFGIDDAQRAMTRRVRCGCRNRRDVTGIQPAVAVHILSGIQNAVVIVKYVVGDAVLIGASGNVGHGR